MKIGIVGATGAVGRQMIKSLEERKIDVSELRLFASPRSLGTKINCFGEDVGVQVVEDGCFKGLDYVLGALFLQLTGSCRHTEEPGRVQVKLYLKIKRSAHPRAMLCQHILQLKYYFSDQALALKFYLSSKSRRLISTTCFPKTDW